MTLARTIKVGNITAAGTSAAATDLLGSSATLDLSLGGQGALAVISGTWTATLQFEAKAAGGTWVAVPAAAILGGAAASSTTANGNFVILAIGAIQVRVRCSAYTSGTAVVELSSIPIGGFNVGVTGTGTGTSAQQVQGTTAVGSPLAGTNPLAMGGNNASGNANFVGINSGGSDALSTSVQGIFTNSYSLGFNGSSFDRLRTASTTGAAGGTTGFLGTSPVLWNGTGYQPATSGATFSGVAAAGVPFSQTGVLSGSGTVVPWRAADQQTDGSSSTSAGVVAGVLFNETNWDRKRNNTQGTLLASGARATTTTATQTNYNARGVAIFLNITVVGTATLTVTIVGVDPVTSTAGTIATFETYGFASGAALRRYLIYPGASAGSYQTAVAAALPRAWQAVATSSDSSNWTFSLGYAYIL